MDPSGGNIAGLVRDMNEDIVIFTFLAFSIDGLLILSRAVWNKELYRWKRRNWP